MNEKKGEVRLKEEKEMRGIKWREDVSKRDTCTQIRVEEKEGDTKKTKRKMEERKWVMLTVRKTEQRGKLRS